MSRHSPVVWSQGMFLLPHHFQQQARHVEYLVDMRAQAVGSAYGWGFFELVLDEALLAVGRVGVVRASGVLPDGTPVRIPQTDAPPPPLDIPPDMKDELVCLAVPLAREGVNEVDFDESASPRPARWLAVEEPLRDHTHAEDEPEAVQTGALRLRLLRARDAAAGHAALGLARVRELRSDRQVVLDRGYIAPQTRLDATAQLSAMATLLHGLMRQQAQQLVQGMGQLSHGVSEMAGFMTLQSLNRAEPVFRQLALAPQVHPFLLHQACLQLAGDLATLLSPARRPPDYPLYRHDDLQGSFAPLVEELRRLLTLAPERHALQIELVERTHSVRTALIPDPDLARKAGFVLAVNAQVASEQLRQRFPAQSTLGPADRIRDLVNLHLPGVPLRLLPVAPRQLPFHAGFHYFELERGGELWKHIERSGSLALHVAGDFPGLELELWAIRP
ncbi:type VI secretion system baseplate subunit TssK [Azohydromonas caseinilytica]|uniref:Type VI secretion system baseplate subunit TssK n=1 Tax=Azohydromonas caseinilytica TaxID=2728836 RepID=A0A848FKE9_9BURK|nr:type VI secretion system baseplate subunit TssK [Azohydromonas caseinilytica]NML18271.1 type VI secretion system baseplate subunit TssK [Azohydromonas caseinilytica]